MLGHTDGRHARAHRIRVCAGPVEGAEPCPGSRGGTTTCPHAPGPCTPSHQSASLARVRLLPLVAHVFGLSGASEARPPDDSGAWRATFSDGTSREYRALCVATGMAWHPRGPDYPGTFSGERYHAFHYHERRCGSAGALRKPAPARASGSDRRAALSRDTPSRVLRAPRHVSAHARRRSARRGLVGPRRSAQAGQSQPNTPAVSSPKSSASPTSLNVCDQGRENQMESGTTASPYAIQATVPAMRNTAR